MTCNISLLATLLVLFSTTGCTILNPYYEQPECRAKVGGKCVDVPTAYAHALYTEDSDNQPVAPPGVSPVAWQGRMDGRDGKGRYQEALYQQMTELLEEPAPPVLIPPKILRVLVNTYEGKEGELYMPSFVFVKVEAARWSLNGDVYEKAE